MADFEDIKTIVVVLMENRSFDHMLGYLSLPSSSRGDVEGQSADPAWLARFANADGGQSFQPFHNDDPYWLPDGFDPPHQRENVSNHLATLTNGQYTMNGFVGAVPQSVSTNPDHRKLVMSYFGPAETPISDFVARHFAICDRWFCAVPSGTQPNRLMAMSGSTVIDRNATPLPDQPLVYDWLTQKGIRWRVYHQGLPFFSMMLRWVPEILLGTHFVPFDRMKTDLESTPPGELPQVIFVEPTYGDAPHFGRSTDDHAPSGISDGQEFLMQVYNAVTSSLAFWKRSLTVVCYDEHGGFFDHVSPPLVETRAPSGATYEAFKSLGPRIPAFLISPYLKAGACVHNTFDHTSVLKLIADRFGDGSYSPEVDGRAVESISTALSFDAPILNPPPAPAMNDYLARRPPVNPYDVTVPPPQTELQQAFREGTSEMKRRNGDNHPVFGPLLAQLPG